MAVTFTLQTGSDLYLAGDAATATAGFLFQTDPSTLPQTFTLSSSSFADPNQQGYFAYFAPGAQSDWAAFAGALRSQFQNASSNVGWFTGTGKNATIVSALNFALNGNQQQMTSSTQFVFPPSGRTATLILQATFPNFPPVNYDDGSDAFQIPNSPQSGNAVAQLTLTNPSTGKQFTYGSTSDNVVIPMSGGLTGTVQCAFALGLADLAIVEAGVSYFGPPPAQGAALTATSFPVVRPAGSAQAVNLAASLDVVQQLNPARCFFQLTDPQLGSYFATATGLALGFTPATVSDPGQSSRFVFANRPVKSTTEQIQYYYLALAGSFALTLPSQNGARDASAAATTTALPVSNAMLCGTTGTEFFSVATGDTLTFVPNQPAYDNSATAVTSGWLTDDALTSWVQWGTTDGAYVAQPQPSPLMQPGTSTALASTDTPAYLLDFFQLPSWSAASGGVAALQETSTGAVSAPLVPMVPFGGVGALDPTLPTAPYSSIEASAIYPQRRSEFLTEAARLAALPRAQANGARAATGPAAYTGQAMTPQGLISQVVDGQWSTLQLAQSPPWTDNAGTPHSGLLQMTYLGSDLIAALQQNQIFLVTSTTGAGKLYSFVDSTTNTTYDEVNIADWIFSLSPDGQAGPALSGDDVPPILKGVSVPPILILKFHKGASIADLYPSLGAWTSPTTFNDPNGFTADQAQAYIAMEIDAARASVAKDGADSIYANFIAVVDDPNFNGMLALNCNLQLNDLPGAIKGVLGGMKDPTIEAFRAHHVGLAINDTKTDSPDLIMTQSALFGLVDYESAGVVKSSLPLDFQVEFMRALFLNAELRLFSCKTDLTINNLFNVDVNLSSLSSGLRMLPAAAGEDSDATNIVTVTGSYQAHSTTGDKTSAGVGVYSFVAEGEFEFDFKGTALENPYLDTITLTKLQFSFDQEQATTTPYESTITSSFAVWGSMVFKELDVLDIFSFEKLSFSDVKIGVTFDLTLTPGTQPTTSGLGLTFSPGDLRVDFGPGQTKERSGASSMLALLPFKLKSFLYSENADQTLESLGYSPVALPSGMPQVIDTFNYALIFDLDLGSVGALVGSLAAFKFSVVVGWQVATTMTTPPITQSGVAFGIKLPEADGKLEIKIEGVIDLLIEQFVLKYVEPTDGTPRMLVVGLHNASLTILGQRIPPSGEFEFALFAPEADSSNPKGGSAKIGWMAAYDNTGGTALANGGNGNGNGNGGNNGNGDSKTFDLKFLGGGQRVGPGPEETFTDFASFLDWMKTDFWTAFEAGDYAKVYHPDENWLVLADIMLLETVEVGFVFYDSTPFYALSLNVAKLFDFEITYTKVSDSIGMFYMNFSLPPELRTYQVGLASLTLPSIAVTVYTNGNFKVDLGFPAGTDWSRCFQVQAQAGPVPITGAGGFYVASLSSATSPKTFQGSYDSILAFGFAAQLGVGKSFTMGPLSAGVSVTFFGIIEGAAGYQSASADEIFKMPDALMLTGNFGIIGQLYGKLDFKIITASVNIVLSASIGIVLTYEPLYGNNGSILLYIEASVEVSVEVKINCGLFSIRITFSFSASIRFDWQLTGPTSSQAPQLAAAFDVRAALTTVLAPIPLITGLTADVPLWFLPEFSVVFPDATTPGTPYFVASLSIPYNNAPDSTILSGYANFQAFESVTMQVTTWALMQALSLQSPQATVTLDDMTQIDQHPDDLVGWIDYPTLLQQLAVFAMAAQVAVAPDGTTLYAAVFPMPGFLTLVTNGRQWNGAAADFDYRFDAQNLVSQQYLDQVASEFDQLYVNQTATQTGNAAEPDTTTTPLVQAMFLEYFKGLIRGAVHELVQTLQGPPETQSMALDQLFVATVAAGGFASLSGLMSSMFRSGVRMPYTAGLTVPGATPATDYNPFYALTWQEFPVGGLSGSTPQYTVALNADSATPWFTSTVSWALTQAFLTPYQGLTASAVQVPSAPAQLPFTNTGPQYFTFENPTAWTGPAGTGGSLRPFPSALVQLQAAQGTAPIGVIVESRAGAAPGTSGTALSPSQFTWATQINLTIKTIPTGAPGSKKYLPDVFALSGASAQDELLLQQIVEILGADDPTFTSPGISVLYQATAGAPGLTSDAIVPADVFALRTNTTTVSAPPAPMLAATLEAAPPAGVPVGATIGGTSRLEQSEFLHIIQQAVVTNASGYYLRYVDANGDSFPSAALASGFAPITLLIPWTADGTQNTQASPAQIQSFYNAIVLSSALDMSLVYYAGTTDAALSIQYPAVAPGAVGFELIGNNTATVSVPADSAAARVLDPDRGYTYHEIISAHVEAGITGEYGLSEQLAPLASATGSAQLNALYALLTYQIEATTGFDASPLSAPVQPQNPDTTTAAPKRVSSETTSAEQTYQVFAPLYNFATANAGLPSSTAPNRYASIGSPFTVGFFVNDAFGNELPGQQQLTATGTNLYFDPIVPVDQWTGIVTSYDFGVPNDTQNPPTAGVFNLLLTPSETAFAGWTNDQFANALPAYDTIRTQIEGPGVSFYAETNFALDAEGNMATIALDAAPITAMVDGMVAYLTDRAKATPPVNPAPFPSPVPFALTIPTGGAALPPVFELSVLIGVERDADLIAPSLKAGDTILYPAAQNVASSVPARFGGTGQPDITTFATAFGIALSGALTLSVGLNGAQQPQQKSTAARARKNLAALGVASDGGSGGSAPQSLFAVASVLLDVSIGTTANSGPFYSSPTPLDNALNTATVDMPVLPTFTPPVTPLPATKLFTDVDLDQLNQQFFAAVDAYLAPASASKAFQLAQIDGNPDAYTPVATGREQIADKYSEHEIDAMFASSPYSPTTDQLTEAKKTFGQQMRAGLASAYALDTILQYLVTWNGTVPSSVGDRIELFGQIGPAAADTTDPAVLAKISLSTAHVPVVAGGDGLLTFLFGTSDVESIQTMTMDLQYNVTHVQYFLTDDTGDDEARPSIWLQLVVPPAPPHIGPVDGGKPVPVTIPVVFRQYPAPPTFVTQSAQAAAQGQCPNANPLVEAAAWDYAYSYQAQVTVHDQLLTSITYNTNLTTSSNGSSSLQALDAPQRYTLFEALARFTAAYAVLGPILLNLENPNWQLAAQAFAPLVTDVVQNTDWDDATTAMLAATPLQYTVDDYVVTDFEQTGSQQRVITMTWPPAQGESSWTGASLAIVGIAPDGKPYPAQTAGTTANGITDTYTPTVPVVNEWVGHQVAVNCLNVLTAENAMAALRIERNAITLPNPSGSAQAESTIQGEFVYMTPTVRPSQPATPFVDNDTPIDVTTLPNGSKLAKLSDQIFTMMNDLLRFDAQLSALLSATKTSDGTDPIVQRKVKVACGFQYPVLTIAGVSVDPKSSPVMPIVPVVLARSFVVDVTTSADIEAFSAAFATAITGWSGQNGVSFGSAGEPPAGRFVFDVTLYAELSGNNTPVLRLRQLFLMLANIDPASTTVSSTTAAH